ncbi:hypothetical protein [uncultured Thiothrix sp.]|uniref:hypothetical protein n=1 Tax=uncultured Thiothrix sp. TaxID=223185 RepID=UPI002623CF6A|nr:hypothetical protein [uncultured Thiothrix sp.]
MSETSLFDLVITGQHSQNPPEFLAREILDLLDVHNAKLEQKLTAAFQTNSCAVSVCPHIQLKAAMLWQKKLTAFSVSSEVRPVVQLEAKVSELELYTCAACGHEQPKAEDKVMQVCQVCGLASQTERNSQGLDDLFHTEQQRREAEKARAISDALKQAKYQEDRRLREEALRGVKPAPAKFAQVLLAVVGTFTVAVGLGIAYFFTSPPEETPSSPPQASAMPTKPRTVTPTNQLSVTSKPAEKSQAVPGVETNLAATKPTDLNTGSQPKAEQVASSVANQPTDATADLKESTESQTPSVANFQPPSAKLVEALEAIEEIHQLQPQSGMASRTLEVDRERIQQLLKINETQLVPQVIASVQRPYAQSLLWLEYAQWQVQQGQIQPAQQTIEEMRKVQATTRDIDQQVLIAGALSKAYLLVNEEAKAESSLQQAIAKAGDVPKRSFQTWLLVQLANEQALLGNSTATHKLLKLTEPLLNPAVAETTPTTAKPAQIISTYALVNEFAEAKNRLKNISDVNKRNALSEWLNQLEAQLH